MHPCCSAAEQCRRRWFLGLWNGLYHRPDDLGTYTRRIAPKDERRCVGAHPRRSCPSDGSEPLGADPFHCYGGRKRYHLQCGPGSLALWQEERGAGYQEARFHLLPLPGGLYNIFVTSEHPSLIYGSEGRIIYSAVTAEDASCVCPFDSEAFPGSIILATDSEVKISQIDNERQTHVRPLPMGETIRRIAYSPSEKVFGLGCIKRELVHGEEIVTSSFKLVDEVIFDTVGTPFPLTTAGEVELVEAVIRAELPDAYGNPSERFIVGTSFLPEPETAVPSDACGRILVFGIDSTRTPYLILSHELKGACRCLAVMQGKIVAALSKTVVISQYEETSSTTGHLTKLASYRPSTYPVNLAIEGNTIAVADVMKSMTTVEFVPGEGGKAPMLVEKARHYQSAWATAVSHVEDNSWLLADAHGNLMVLRSNPEGVTNEDKRRMEITSEFNLGEMVNHISKIAVATTPNAMIIPKAFLGTVRLLPPLPYLLCFMLWCVTLYIPGC